MKEVYGSMALDTPEIYTTKDIEALPEGTRAELYDGEMVYMEAPSVTHQSLLFELLLLFGTYQKSNGGKCRTFMAPCGVHLSDECNYLEPDLLIVCPKEENENRIQTNGIYGAPDFVLEIVSPSSKYNDYYKKTGRYSEYGVREYWIVDPEKKRITVNYFEGRNEPTIYTFEDSVPVNIYGDLSINFRDLDYLV